MDYNKAFLSYENLSGTRCHATDGKQSQQEAAEEAVKNIGLNQTREIDPVWFDDEKTKKMFFQRLDFLKSVEKEIDNQNNKTSTEKQISVKVL